jgi:hypothetical protein
MSRQSNGAAAMAHGFGTGLLLVAPFLIWLDWRAAATTALLGLNFVSIGWWWR